MCWLCSDRRRAPLVEGCHVRRGAGQDDRAHPFHVRHPFLNLPANRVLPAWLVLVPKRCAVRSSRLTYPSAFPRLRQVQWVHENTGGRMYTLGLQFVV